MDITPLLRILVKSKGSDLYFISGTVPQIKVHGEIQSTGEIELPRGATTAIAHSLMTERQAADFQSQWELNLVHHVHGLGRFRVNIYRERGEIALVVRRIPFDVPTLELLKAPPAVRNLVMGRQGLVLIAGPTGSGKSTTVAAMIQHRVQNMCGHVLTIEDPIEFLHNHSQAIVSQREIGVDTHSYGHALKNALRESPDVIMIGEIRDAETMHYALNYAQTGHLCISTLHANNAQQAIERILNFYPPESHNHVLLDLSTTLQGIVSQRLIKNTSRRLQITTEILLHNATVKERLQKGEISELNLVMEEHHEDGMMTFNQSLLDLYNLGQIGKEDALRASDAHTDLSLQMQLGNTSSSTQIKYDSDFDLSTEL